MEAFTFTTCIGHMTRDSSSEQTSQRRFGNRSRSNGRRGSRNSSSGGFASSTADQYLSYQLHSSGRMSSAPTNNRQPATEGAGGGGGKNGNRQDASAATPARCLNPASEVNARLDTQVEVRVYPCNNSQSNGKKKFTTFNVRPEVKYNDYYRFVFICC